MNNQEEIKKLKRKRDSLRTKIGEWRDRGKNAYDFSVEYQKLTECLRKLGCKVEARAEWLQPEFWDKNHNKPKKKIQKKSQSQPKPTKTEQTQEKNIYILSLAWIEGPNINNDNDFTYTLEKVSKYLQTLGLKKVEEDFNEISDKIERIIKYMLLLVVVVMLYILLMEIVFCMKINLR